jgi:hypothetical protein
MSVIGGVEIDFFFHFLFFFVFEHLNSKRGRHGGMCHIVREVTEAHGLGTKIK